MRAIRYDSPEADIGTHGGPSPFEDRPELDGPDAAVEFGHLFDRGRARSFSSVATGIADRIGVRPAG